MKENVLSTELIHHNGNIRIYSINIIHIQQLSLTMELKLESSSQDVLSKPIHHTLYSYTRTDHKQDKNDPSLLSTSACVSASTSAFVFAFITLTLAWHHEVAITLASVGSLFVPHVSTSGGVSDCAVVTLVRTKSMASASVHDPLASG